MRFASMIFVSIFILYQSTFPVSFITLNLSFNQLGNNLCFFYRFFTKTVSPSLISLTVDFRTLSALSFIFSFISLSFLSNSVSCGSLGMYSGILFLMLRPKNIVARHWPVIA